MARATRAKGPSVAELKEEIENLRSENSELQETLDLTEQALDEANSRLTSISESAEEVLPEDFAEDSDEDSDDEESDEGNGEED